MAFYNKKFITYPFASEKYGHAQFGWSGGMEHQTMSFMASLDFELVAHEMAHQWFGNYITLASWHDIWLNEGFATYLTGLTYENLLDGKYWASWKNIQVNRITSSNNGSVYVADTTNINRIFDGRLSYSKGAYLLHMLRWELGDEKFFKGLGNYLNDKSLAYGFASQEKFVEHIETAADTSLTEFFKDWYYGEGFPTYQIVPFFDGGKQKVRISQTPSSPSTAFFEMHIPLRIWKDGEYKDIRVYNTTQNQEFTVANFHADKIELDPDKWLITKSVIAMELPHVIEIQKLQIIYEQLSGSIRVLIPPDLGSGFLRLFDMEGRIIKTARLEDSDTSTNITEFRKGIYIAEVQLETTTERKKIFHRGR
jgi:aminopeptidase N